MPRVKNQGDHPLAEIELAIEMRLAEAARTVARLRVSHTRPSQAMTFWPDTVRNVFEAYDIAGANRVNRPLPTPSEITRMDETVGWLFAVEREVWPILWARALGQSWRRVAKATGHSSHMTVRRLHEKAMAKLVERVLKDLL